MASFMWETGIDFAFLIIPFIIFYLIIDILLVRFLKPEKKVIKAALIAGLVLSISDFIMEVYTTTIGLWGYISDYTIMGIPVTAPIYHIISGFGIALFYSKSLDYLKKKVDLPHFGIIFSLLFIALLSLLTTFGDIIVADFGWSPYNWNYTYTFFAWFILWLATISSFVILERSFK